MTWAAGERTHPLLLKEGGGRRYTSLTEAPANAARDYTCSSSKMIIPKDGH